MTPASSASTVQLTGVTVHSPSGTTILDGINLTVGAGEAVAFIGPSGAGKTTALKLLNGLVEPSEGTVSIDGQTMATLDRIALRRSTGYIIQGAGLFPHRTVLDNIATVPRLLGWSRDEILQASTRLLAALEMPAAIYGARFPRSLSGGEQQRVGIARALIARPRMLLCDEPFAALDPVLRRDQQRAFSLLRKDRPVTVVFVTHDLVEARRIADRLVLFERGKIVADASGREFQTIDHPLVRRFVEASAAESI